MMKIGPYQEGQSVELTRQQIAKMRDDFALERRRQLHLSLKESARLSIKARQHLQEAIAAQQSFERQALLPSRCSDEMIELIRRVDNRM